MPAKLPPLKYTKLCACGCGDVIHIDTETKPRYRFKPPSYLTRHRPRRVAPKPEKISSGICECGCGQPTPLATRTQSRHGIFKGYPLRFIPYHHLGKAGELSPNWKGGKFRSRGYILVHNPNHPHSTKDGYVFEHRLVMEQKIERYLGPNEIIHHINGIKDDNRTENLLLVTRSDHKINHRKNGELHGVCAHQRKLTYDDVVNIKERLVVGESLTNIAKEYGITKQNVWLIKNNRTWKHV